MQTCTNLYFVFATLFAFVFILFDNVEASHEHLHGHHGSLHPNDSNGTVNNEKLEVWFDPDCVTTEEEAKAMYSSLLEDFSECLWENEKRKTNLYYVTKLGQWHGYFGLVIDNCVDNIDVDYDDYCISDFDYEQVYSCDVSCESDYAHYNGEWLWWLDRINKYSNDYYKYLSLDSTKGVDFYILDTGVLSTHDEFDGISVIHLDDDWDDSSIIHYHGTHVAGTAAGVNVGVARGFTKIFSYAQCRGEGATCDLQDIEDGYDAVIAKLKVRTEWNKRGVINMSWGGYWSSSRLSDTNAYFEEMEDYGAVIVSSAGNDAIDACSHGPSACDNVISVGSYYWDDISKTGDDEVADTSNYGDCVDVYAPGKWIYSSVITCDSCYEWRSGTSMASPVVAGLIATMIAYDDSLTTSQIRSILTDDSSTFEIDNCPNTNSWPCLGVKVSCYWMGTLIDQYSTNSRLSESDSDKTDTSSNNDNQVNSDDSNSKSNTSNNEISWWVVWLVIAASIMAIGAIICIFYFRCKPTTKTESLLAQDSLQLASM